MDGYDGELWTLGYLVAILTYNTIILIHLNNILISSNLLTIIKFYQVNIVDTIIETQNKNNMISIKI